MATAIDLGALTLGSGPKVTLANGIVSQSGSGTDYTGWSDVSTVYVEAKCQIRDGSRGFARLVLTIEGSSDGNSWSTLQTFTFGAGGSGAKQTATVSLTQDHLRAAWATTGAGEWNIEYVNVAPASINIAGVGGFDVVSCVIARDGSLDIHDVGDHPVVWDALYDNYQDFNTLTEIPDGLGLDFAFDDSSSEITTTEAGVWAFVYNFSLSQDANWKGAFDTRFGGQKVDPASGAPALVSHLLALPTGVTFTPQFSTGNAASADPYTVGGVYLIATRLA